MCHYIVVVMWNCNSRNMMERNLFISILFLVVAIIFSAISQCSSALSDKRLCYDPNCSEPVSLAKTLINYHPNEPGLLSFGINVDVKVYSKEAGNRNDLWGVEINGKHGYVSKTFLKEYKILQKKLKYEVPVIPLHNNNISSNEKIKSKKNNDKSMFNTKKIDISNTQINNLDLKSTKELPYNVTDVTSSQEVVQDTILSNTKDAIDNSKISSTNGKIESNTLTKDDKVLKEVPERISDLPKILGIPLNTNVTPEKAKLTAEKIKNNLATNAKDNQSLEEVVDSNVPQESISDGAREVVYDAPNDIKSGEKHIENSDEINTKSIKSSENITTDAGSVTQSDVQNVTTSEKIETKGTESSENVITDASSVTESDVQNVKAPEGIEVKSIDSSENITADAGSVTQSDIQNVTGSDKIETKGTESSENTTTDAGSVTQSDVQNVTASEKIEIEDTESLENATIDASSVTESDLQNVTASEKIETKGTESLENATIDASSITQPDVQNITGSDKIEIKGTESSENVTTDAAGVTQPDQNVTASNKIEEKDIESSENVTTVAASATQPDQNVTASEKIETKDTESSEDVTTDADSVTLPDVQNVKAPEGIEVKGTESSENVTTDTQPDVQDVITSDEIETESTESLENVVSSTSDTIPSVQSAESTGTTDMEDTPFLGSSTKLKTKKYELRNEEIESISPLFLQLNAQDTVPMALSDNNEASEQSTETTSEFDAKDVQSDSNVVDIVPVKQARLDSQLNTYTEDVVSVAESTSNVESNLHIEDTVPTEEVTSEHPFHQVQVFSPDICLDDNGECSAEDNSTPQHSINVPHHEQYSQDSENAVIHEIQLEGNYWLTLIYLSVTATATLIFCLGYYCIENMRRDGHLIARINKLEKDLLISEAECTMMNDNLKSTKEKLVRMEDESFGSDEMVLSLRADLEASQNAKAELEDQVAMLEKDLESATEAGLELERMLREVLSSNNEVNPLAQSVEDLQTRLNTQQAANESLTNALNFKTQELEFDKLENESLSIELASVKKKYEELEVELARISEYLKQEINNKNNIEQTLTDRVQQLEMQLKEISTEKATLQKELKGKEVEAKDLVEVINRLNSNNLDMDKLYDVSHIKAEATALLEERNELKIKLAEVEGAHNLLEEHVKVIKEEILSLSEQCKTAEKEKKDAETRLEVLTNFFEEKEAQRQKEEAIWLQQQGEVVSTVERIQTMQNEIQNYKQQIEMLKREILDQEREYKNQISLLETKAHEQWVMARQVERRLEESKVEAGQLRNRLTLIEKSINDVDSEAKLHRLEANGETTTSPPLFIGAESSNSPIMFSGSSSVPPPPPPSYLHSLFPPYLPPPLPNTSGVPPYEVSQRPPPLGGRLSSPPPMPLHPPSSNRYDNAGSPPPMSPRLLPPFNHRSPPPPPFGSDMHPLPPPPPGSILPLPLGTPHSWGEESLPPLRNPGFHPPQRERVRNHKGRKRFSKVRQFWSTMEGNNCKVPCILRENHWISHIITAK
ncbi:Transport and Golgi organization protein 1, partial [Anthophora retusa]